MNMPVVDARGLEPPEPFERAMEALANMESGGQFTLLLDRMPHPLLRMLDRDGYRHDVSFRDDGSVAILIGRP
ncbi:MAG TPA: DUF2249 domain-containing protein [Thauera sp.]|nr:DUF2249 domain-containing protein [Thauera sp.]HRA81620.1 DUF2249 domain-containing protein [Thauera sp.]